jgi:hypothetical protein
LAFTLLSFFPDNTEKEMKKIALIYLVVLLMTGLLWVAAGNSEEEIALPPIKISKVTVKPAANAQDSIINKSCGKIETSRLASNEKPAALKELPVVSMSPVTAKH